MVCSVLMLVLLLLYVMFSMQIGSQTRRSLEDKALTIARTVALTPLVGEGLQAKNSKEINAFAAKIQRINDVRFVVVIDMQGIRYSHPNPDEIGKPFQGGDEGTVLRGQAGISEGEGVLGKSVRAFMPVYSNRGVQLGAVVVGISMSRIEQNVGQNKWIIAGALALGALLGALGAMLLAGKIKKIMFGLEPEQISVLLEERSAMLQSTREGIIAVDERGCITLINQEAERLIRLGESGGSMEMPLRRRISELWPALHLEEVLEEGQAKRDEEIGMNGILLLANSLPIRVNGSISGAIITFRDKTEIIQLAERLSGVSLYAEALRAQTHEFMNKLHVVMGMVHMGLHEDLVQYISGTVNSYNEDIGSITRKIKDPVMAGFLLGKFSRAREAGVQLILTEDSYLPEAGDSSIMHELITIVGNLLDNALDAVKDRDSKTVVFAFHYNQGRLVCNVKDNGGGIPMHQREHIFTQGYSTKGTDRGMGLHLVRRSIDKLHGRLTLADGEGPGADFCAEMPYTAKDEDVVWE